MPYCRADSFDSIPMPGSRQNIPESYQPATGSVPETPLKDASLPAIDQAAPTTPEASSPGNAEAQGAGAEEPETKDRDPVQADGAWCRVRDFFAPLTDTLRDIARCLVDDFRSPDFEEHILQLGSQLAKSCTVAIAFVDVAAVGDLTLSHATLSNSPMAFGMVFVAMPLAALGSYRAATFLENKSIMLAKPVHCNISNVSAD